MIADWKVVESTLCKANKKKGGDKDTNADPAPKLADAPEFNAS